jgi:outer membrane protein assembly factor BamB
LKPANLFTVIFLSLMTLFSVLVVGVAVPVSAASPSTYPWPFMRHDLNNTGAVDSLGPLDNVTLWQTNLTDCLGIAVNVRAHCAVDAGLVVMPTSAQVVCLNESTGAVVWTAQPAGATLYTGAVIDAVKGLVIVGSFNGYVSALDIADGSTKWSFSLLSGSWFVAPPQVDLGWDNGTGNAFGLVLIGDFNPAPSTTRGLYAINETDGSLIWKFTVPWSPPGGFGITSTAAVSNGRVFIGTVGLGGVGGTFYCLNETNGAVIWSRPSNGNFGGAPAVADGKVFIGTGGATTGNSGGYALALDEATGAVVWNVSLAYWTAMKVGTTQGPAVDVEEGAVYFEAEAPGGAQGGTLAKLNMTDGSTVWKFTFASFPEGQGDGGNAPYIPASAPALATRGGQKLIYISGVDNPYVANGHEKVFCFNADHGRLGLELSAARRQHRWSQVKRLLLLSLFAHRCG